MSAAREKSETSQPAKIALVQSLLDALMGETAIEMTVILSNTLVHNRSGRTDRSADATGKIPSLVLEGRSLEALSLCHTALRAADSAPAAAALKPTVAELRKVLERELLTQQDIDLVSGTRRTHLLPRRTVLIGRPSMEKTVDVAVNCRWFSRGDRNLSLFSDGPNWFIEDLGSTNGHYIQGRALKPGHPMALAVGETRIDVGAAKSKPSPAAIHLHRPAKDPGAVVVTLSGAIATGVEADPWPTMAQDTMRRWVVFREQIGVSAANDCALSVDAGPDGILAAIRYQSGFWIVPSAQGSLDIDGIAFHESVPLPAGTTLSLCGAPLRVEAQEAPAATSEPHALAG